MYVCLNYSLVNSRIIIIIRYAYPSRDVAPMNCDGGKQHDSTDPGRNRPTSVAASATYLWDDHGGASTMAEYPAQHGC